MTKIIDIEVDIYKNYFGNIEDQKYCYDNIRAVNRRDIELLDDCLQEMINSDLLFINKPITPKNDQEPVDTNVRCKLDLVNKSFIF